MQAGMAIHQLIVEAHLENNHDRRHELRYPFFRRVSVHTADGRRYSAFTREISASGVGLIHNMELLSGEVELTIPSERGCSIRVRTRIVWCQSCGEGWYLSGGKFVGIAGIGM